MAWNSTPEAAGGMWQAVKDSFGLFQDTNKALSPNELGSPLPQEPYESSLKEDEIILLVSDWKRTYLTYYDLIDKTQIKAFNYWIGNQKLDETNPTQTSNDTPELTDNLIFESLETFLPIATRANPDPLVSADPSDEGQQMAHDIQAALVHLADILKLRRKLARMTRGWALNRLGAMKVSWNPTTKEIETEVINTRSMIFDKDGYIDDGAKFKGEYLGQKKKETADRLCKMFPKKKADITIKAKGKMGTKLEYYEWWYRGTDLFFTLDDIVLGKYKNPNWNYDVPPQDAKDEIRDEEGNVTVPAQPPTPQFPGVNHLLEPADPYTFLSVFSAGLHPHDETSLILQNISLQDNINHTGRQIKKNVEGMNNGMVVSGDYFDEAQASQAAAALRRGVTIRQPKGKPADGVMRFPPTPIPSQVFEDRNDSRERLRAIFGTSGSTPEATAHEKTVRGKIQVQQQDSSRIGGTITEQLEQVADAIYNLWVQFMFVYYDEEHYITTDGQQGGMELVQLKNSNFGLLKTLVVTVKEGSLIPKDPLTQRNEAMDLWSAGAIDPLTFFKRLDDPDPSQSASQLILWQMFQKGQIAPNQYLPSFSIPQVPGAVPPIGAMPSPQGVGGPAVNPLGKSQNEQNVPAVQGTPPAVEAQSSALIKSAPIAPIR